MMAFSIKQNDTSPSLLVTLQDGDGNPVNITGATVRFHMVDLARTVKVDAAMSLVNPSVGLVRYDWQAVDTDTVGTYYAEFEVTYSDNSIETFPNTGSIAIVITPELN